jgi:hypothetical protein
MEPIIEDRTNVLPSNAYPCHIISPPQPSARCATHIERIGHNAVDAE